MAVEPRKKISTGNPTRGESRVLKTYRKIKTLSPSARGIRTPRSPGAERHRPLMKENAAETSCWLAEDGRSDAEARGVSGVPGQANPVGGTAVRVGVRPGQRPQHLPGRWHVKTRSLVIRTSQPEQLGR